MIGIGKLLDKIESVRPFTEDEAWGLFRLVAFGEAVGWTLLIGAILYRHFQLPDYRFAVPICGQIHGMLFLAYFGITLAVYSSLRWPRLKFLLAVVSGVPPYGSLLFELWTASRQHRQRRQAYLSNLVLSTIAD